MNVDTLILVTTDGVVRLVNVSDWSRVIDYSLERSDTGRPVTLGAQFDTRTNILTVFEYRPLGKDTLETANITMSN